MTRKFENQTSITGVTAELMDFIPMMSIDQKRRLLSDLAKTQSINSRTHARKDYLINVHYMVNHQLYNGFIKNISSGGAFVEHPRNTMQRLNTGQPVTLTFDHPDKKIPIKITGKITRIEDSGFGVNFDDLL